MKWRAILAIVRKDLVDAIKNTYILFGLVLPIAMSLLLRIAFPSSTETTITIAVYDPGKSRLVAELQALPQLQLVEVASAEALPGAVERRVTGGLLVPAGFDAAVTAGERPPLTVYVNRRQGGGAVAAFQALIQQQVWSLVGQPIPARITWMELGTAPGLLQGGQFRLDTYMLILFLVMAMVMTGVLIVPILLVEEKEKHTLEALLVSPAGAVEVIVSKALTGLIYSVLIATILLAMNRGWSGNWPITALALLLGALFMILIGLLMGAFFHSTVQVSTWATLVMLALMMPSWFTIMTLPAPLEALLRLVPTFYIQRMLGLALAGEASPGRVWGDLAVVLGSTAAAFAITVWALRKREYGGI